MDSEQKQFLSLSILPARLNVEQAAWYLGFQPHDIPILVAAGILKPLGQPAANGTKYFATAELDGFRQDRRWLSKASGAIQDFWRRKNQPITTLKETVSDG